MGLLTIDETKCKKDGLCVRECPMVIIKLKDGDGIPEIVAGGENACNDCGHCVAICPHGALDHAEVPLSEMFGYATDLRSMTQGRATYTMQFSHYAQVPPSVADKIVYR